MQLVEDWHGVVVFWDYDIYNLLMSKKVLTKAKVVSHLNENIGLSKESVSFFLSPSLNYLFTINKQKDVKIVNFGIFKIKNKKQEWKKPKNKRRSNDFERNVIKFKPSNFLINLINVNTGKSDTK